MISNMIVWSPGTTLEIVEEQIIKRALAHYNGNKTITASSLGIAVRTLENKLEKYEAQEKEDKRIAEEEKFKRDDFLARCRGKRVEPQHPEPVKVVDEHIQQDDDSIQTTNLRSKRR